MKTLQLRYGDLVIGPGGHQTIGGPSRLVQDLRGALAEPVGNDRFHPGWGSHIDEYIGGVSDHSTAFMIEQEVQRVVGNYQAVQNEKLDMDRFSGNRPRYTTADLMSYVSRVRSTRYHDRVSIMLEVRTMSGREVAVQVESGGFNA